MDQIPQGLDGHWSCFRSSNSPLPADSFAHGIAADKHNRVWLNVYVTHRPRPIAEPYALFLTDGVAWSRYRYGECGLPLEAIYHMAVDSRDRVWFATARDGIYSFDGHTVTLYEYGRCGLPKEDWPTSIHVDGSDRVWVAMILQGIHRLDNGSWDRVMDCTAASSHGHPVAFGVDRDGCLWVACSDPCGADFLSHRAGDWEVVCSLVKHFRLPGGVNCFTVDGSDRVWVGTERDGLLVWETGRWHRLSKRDCPLLGYDIQSLAIDEFGNLWAGTASGFAVYDGARWHSWEAIWPESTKQPVTIQDLVDVDEETRSGYVYIGGRMAIDGLGRKWMETGTGIVLFSPRPSDRTNSAK
jgi:hypothetical protein